MSQIAALAVVRLAEFKNYSGKLITLFSPYASRGAPMTAKCTAQLLTDLGVTQSFSRPRVSDDIPFSEAQFKTLKYNPGFPGSFDEKRQHTNLNGHYYWTFARHCLELVEFRTPVDLTKLLSHKTE